MMLELVAEKLTACFDKRLTLSEIERLKMILGFESLLHQFVLIGIIIIFACVLEIVRPVTLFLAVFGTYGTIAGGFPFINKFEMYDCDYSNYDYRNKAGIGNFYENRSNFLNLGGYIGDCLVLCT